MRSATLGAKTARRGLGLLLTLGLVSGLASAQTLPLGAPPAPQGAGVGDGSWPKEIRSGDLFFTVYRHIVELKWPHELDTQNRLKGDIVWLKAVFKF